MLKGIKNFFIIILIKIFNIFHKTDSYDSHNPRILLVCTTALGDNIWSTPFFKAIKAKLPTSIIGYLTSNSGIAVTENNPYIDKRYNINNTNLFKLYKHIKFYRFQAVIVFHASNRLIYPLVAMLKPEYLVGINKEVKQLETIFSHLVNSNNEHPVLIRNRMLKKINLFTDPQQLELVLYPQNSDYSVAKNYINDKGLTNQLVIGIHPGSSQARKQWPTEKFKQLINLLHKKYPDAYFLITGSMNEQSLLSKFKPLNEKVILLDQHFSILSLAALLSLIDLYITNDTGPMHIASAMKVPIIAISKLDNNTGPYNNSPKAIITCGEKQRYPIPKDTAAYIHRVRVDDVLEATNLLMVKKFNK